MPQGQRTALAGEAGSASVQRRTHALTLRAGLITLPCHRPPAAQALKWGWVQFGAVFLVLWWLLTWFECRVFRFRVLDTRVLSDVPAVRGGGGGSGGQRF